MELSTWATLIIDQLVQLGVSYFVISPGSRSTPLAIAIAEHPSPQLSAHIHFDERGTAFHALGYAKGSKNLAAVLVTTGTAAGNLLPAIMEASQSFIPTLFITCDRPPELRDCGANQTIDQVKIFSSFVRWEIDLPCPSSSLSAEYLRSSLAQAVFRAMDTPQGPVHINCMFREPLTSPYVSYPSLPPCLYASSERIPSQATLHEWGSLLNQSSRGIILLGSLPPLPTRKAFYALAEKLGWPIFPDILSGAREDRLHTHTIPYYDLILKNIQNLRPDLVLHIGDRMVSKTVQEWLKKNPPAHYLSVSDHPFRQDPLHAVTHRMAAPPLAFCEMLLPFLTDHASEEWLSEWQELSALIASKLTEWKQRDSSINEPAIALSLTHIPRDWAIFVSNSMPIRDADMFLFPKEGLSPLFANRGVSGIDGNIATAVGIAQGKNTPTVALLGDMAALHDLNSLAQLKQAPYPVICIIINNGGGGIFSFFKGPAQKPCFEEFFACSHSYSFKHAALLFDLPFFYPQTQDDYDQLLHSCIEKRKSCIIEVVTKRHENLTLHESLYLCSLTRQQVQKTSLP